MSSLGDAVKNILDENAKLRDALPGASELELCAKALDLLDYIANQLPDFYIESPDFGRILLSEAVGSDSDGAQRYLREHAAKIREVTKENPHED